MEREYYLLGLDLETNLKHNILRGFKSLVEVKSYIKENMIDINLVIAIKFKRMYYLILFENEFKKVVIFKDFLYANIRVTKNGRIGSRMTKFFNFRDIPYNISTMKIRDFKNIKTNKLMKIDKKIQVYRYIDKKFKNITRYNYSNMYVKALEECLL